MADCQKDPVIRTAQSVMHITDIQTKIKEKSVAKSKQFSCDDDPKPVKYVIQVSFGATETGYFSLGLFPIDQESWQDVTVKRLRLSVFDREGLLLSNVARSGWGSRRMVSLDKLQGPSLVVHCFLEYLPHGAVPLAAVDFKTQLQSDVIDMFETGYFSDVKFVVQGEEINAHKIVLSSRSSYFGNMFRAEMKESLFNRVE